jgi:hypothetical protein
MLMCRSAISMSAEFDSRSWPLLHVRFVGPDSDESVQALLDALFQHLSRSRCAVVVDTSEMVYPQLQDAQRWTRQQGNWLLKHRELVIRNCCGVGFVMVNAVARFILTGILLIAPLPCEHVVVATSLEARAFCEGRLRADQVSLAASNRPSAILRTPMSSSRSSPPKTGS